MLDLEEWAKRNLDPADPELLEELQRESLRRWGHVEMRNKCINYAKNVFIKIKYGFRGT